jgi:hypothetical protein
LHEYLPNLTRVNHFWVNLREHAHIVRKLAA